MLILVFLVGGQLACKDPGREGDTVRPRPLQVTFAGCVGVREGPVCELRAGSPTDIRLWVDGLDHAGISVSVDGRVLPHRITPRALGATVHIAVPSKASRLELVAKRGDLRSHWSLAFAQPFFCPDVHKAESFFSEGRFQEILEALSSSGKVPAHCLGPRLSVLARALLALGRAEQAAEQLRQAMHHQRTDGQLSAWINDGLTLVYLLIFMQRDFGQARKMLAKLEAGASLFAKGRIQVPYYRGQLAQETGDVRGALRLFAEVGEWSQRLGIDRLHFAAVQAQADLLQMLGRDHDARSMLDQLLARHAKRLKPCDRADLLVNIGWLRLLRREGQAKRQPVEGHDPVGLLEEALAIYRSACPQRKKETNAMVNLALAAMQGGKLDLADSYLAKTRALHAESDTLITPWLLDLEGRIALGRGRPRAALSVYEAMLKTVPPLSQGRWRASLGCALALEALGRLGPAVSAYRRAEKLLDEQILLVPLAEGRGSFLGERDRGAKRLVNLLLGLGRTADALAAARHSRSRVLRSLQGAERLSHLTADQRSGWEKGIGRFRARQAHLETLQDRLREAARDEIPGIEREISLVGRQARRALDDAYSLLPGPGMENPVPDRPDPDLVLLVYHPLPDGWVAFGVTPDGVEAHRLGQVDLQADLKILSRKLLGPFAEPIRKASRIHVLGFGPLSQLDFHALPWGEDLLIDHAPVAYPLDVVLPKVSRGPPARAQAALMVVDPGGNLRGARRSADAIQGILKEKLGLSVRLFEQKRATRKNVLDSLGQVDLFHYSGHALFDGHEGWSSRMALAARGSLGIGDVLALPRVPARVVLAACESGRTDATSGTQTLGLGQAFVTAGSRTVIVATRPLEDEMASRLFETLYRYGEVDPADALRKAQLEIRGHCKDCDWASSRVLVP